MLEIILSKPSLCHVDAGIPLLLLSFGAPLTRLAHHKSH